MAEHIAPLPPIERLRAALSYNPHTGEIRWRIQPAARIQAGAIAGTINPSGYRYITFDGKPTAAHRIAWALHNGIDPYPLEIDHINLNKSDNTLCNLRPATGSQNCSNKDPNVYKRRKLHKRPVSITYPDGRGTLTTDSLRTAEQILNTSRGYLHKLCNTGRTLRKGGRYGWDSGITIAYAE
jgi:hypothetical protein